MRPLSDGGAGPSWIAGGGVPALLLCLIGTGAAAAPRAPRSGPQNAPLPAQLQEPGLATPQMRAETASLQRVCGQCHALQIVLDTPMSYEAWLATLQKMVDQGARGSDAEYDDIMDFLHRTMTTIDVNAADTDELQSVLNVSAATAEAILARRRDRRFSDLADLKTVTGVDAAGIDRRARLIFFQ
jgi:competence protein ComEA